MIKRRDLLKWTALLPALSLARGAEAGVKVLSKFSKSDWQQRLPPESYRVLFEEATERATSSPLNQEKREGLYACAACYSPLFDSAHKFESGTGWPSFFQPREGQVATRTDYLLFYPRTEYHCAHCGGHQGHVFDDGPPPTGKRYCNNGVALRFVAKGEALPAPRGLS